VSASTVSAHTHTPLYTEVPVKVSRA
jgi:hypothetical protein